MAEQNIHNLLSGLPEPTRFLRRIIFTLGLLALPLGSLNAVTSIDTAFINKTVIFFFDADSTGRVLPSKLDATGFLLSVPRKDGRSNYPLLVTARHVVDPIWAGCASTNPIRLFARVNKMHFDAQVDDTGVSFVPVELFKDGRQTWAKSDDESVDVAILNAPPELSSRDYDVRFLNFRNFGKPEEVAKLGIGSQTASTGLVPGIEGQKRNNPIFHFGKIASLPDEPATFRCRQASQPRPLRVWWIATTLVPGTSGSPIFFDPLFPPGADISAGEPRAMLIGLQSLALPGGDLAGMTPAKYIIDVISHFVPGDADLSLGLPKK